MMTQHPLILAHDQTYSMKFPLILIIGREPNNESTSDGKLGFYDFVEYPRCAFWNVAFNILGKVNGSTCKEMKQEFLQRKASPIIFADAFPQGIKNVVSDKISIRQKQIELAEQQVASLFEHEEVIDRIKLVLFSGLSNAVYDKFKELVKAKFNSNGILIKDIPFLYPTNTPAIVNSLSNEDQKVIQEIYSKYVVDTSLLKLNEPSQW